METRTTPPEISTLQNKVVKEATAEKAGMLLPTDYSPAEIKVMVSKAEALIKAMDDIIKLSLLKTNPDDWAKFGNGFWLCESGAMKIRNVWGIYFRGLTIASEKDPDDGSITYTAMCECGSTWLDLWYGQQVLIDAYGSRSTKDPFFGENQDKQDVKKAAIANMRARAVCDLLGLKNMAEADLKRVGIDVAKIPIVEFKKGSKGGAVASEEDKSIQKRLYDNLIKYCETADEAVIKQTLIELTQFTAKDGKKVPGVDSLKYLTGTRLRIAHGKLEQLMAKKLPQEKEIDIREPGQEG